MPDKIEFLTTASLTIINLSNYFVLKLVKSNADSLLTSLVSFDKFATVDGESGRQEGGCLETIQLGKKLLNSFSPMPKLMKMFRRRRGFPPLNRSLSMETLTWGSATNEISYNGSVE